MQPKNAIIFSLCAVFSFSSCHKSGKGSAGTTTVYAAGEWGNLRYNVAAYWVNGQLISLTDTTHVAFARSIYVSGKDVYVAGMIGKPGDPNSDVAVYWKNGQLTELRGAYATVSAIAVSGNDVYIAGEQSDTITNNQKAILWKNEVLTSLSDGSEDVLTHGITIDGADVYVCGNTQGTVGYTQTIWKNGQILPLRAGASAPLYAWGIAAVNGSVYIGGNETVSGQIIAAYWSTAGIVVLDQQPAQSSTVWSIFVQ